MRSRCEWTAPPTFRQADEGGAHDPRCSMIPAHPSQRSRATLRRIELGVRLHRRRWQKPAEGWLQAWRLRKNPCHTVARACLSAAARRTPAPKRPLKQPTIEKIIALFWRLPTGGTEAAWRSASLGLPAIVPRGHRAHMCPCFTRSFSERSTALGLKPSGVAEALKRRRASRIRLRRAAWSVPATNN